MLSFIPVESPRLPDPLLLSDRELAAWRGMLEIHARVTRELDAQMRAAHGMSVSAYEVLMFLGDAPDHRLRMSDLADRVLLSRSGCTRLVDRLLARGDVIRCADAHDGRGLYAEITDAGLTTLRAARTTHLSGVREIFLHRLADTDQVVLGEVWDRMREAPGDANAPSSATASDPTTSADAAVPSTTTTTPAVDGAVPSAPGAADADADADVPSPAPAANRELGI